MKKLLYVGLGVLAFVGVIFYPWEYYVWLPLAALLILDIIKRRFVRTLSYVLGIALGYVAIAVLLGYIFAGPVVEEYTQRTSFDSVSWKQGDSLKKPVRIHMIDDLLKNMTLVGMSKTQIDNLLGPPSATSKFKEYDYVYWLGPERGPFDIDSEWLGIRFKDGVVSEVTVVRD